MVDITTGKVSFLRVFTSFFARFPHEKMHTDIDQFSPIGVFGFRVNQTIGDFAFRVFFEPGLGSSPNRVEMKLESS